MFTSENIYKKVIINKEDKTISTEHTTGTNLNSISNYPKKIYYKVRKKTEDEYKTCVKKKLNAPKDLSYDFSSNKKSNMNMNEMPNSEKNKIIEKAKEAKEIKEIKEIKENQGIKNSMTLQNKNDIKNEIKTKVLKIKNQVNSYDKPDSNRTDKLKIKFKNVNMIDNNISTSESLSENIKNENIINTLPNFIYNNEIYKLNKEKEIKNNSNITESNLKKVYTNINKLVQSTYKIDTNSSKKDQNLIKTEPNLNIIDPHFNKPGKSSNKKEPNFNMSDKSSNKKEPSLNITEKSSNKKETSVNMSETNSNKKDISFNMSEKSSNKKEINSSINELNLIKKEPNSNKKFSDLNINKKDSNLNSKTIEEINYYKMPSDTMPKTLKKRSAFSPEFKKEVCPGFMIRTIKNNESKICCNIRGIKEDLKINHNKSVDNLNNLKRRHLNNPNNCTALIIPSKKSIDLTYLSHTTAKPSNLTNQTDYSNNPNANKISNIPNNKYAYNLNQIGNTQSKLVKNLGSYSMANLNITAVDKESLRKLMQANQVVDASNGQKPANLYQYFYNGQPIEKKRQKSAERTRHGQGINMGANPNNYNQLCDLYKSNIIIPNYNYLASKYKIFKLGTYTIAGTDSMGKQKINQDSFISKEDKLTQDCSQYTLGVFDGHGINGHYVSQAIKNFLTKVNYQELQDENKINYTIQKLTNYINNYSRIDITFSGSTFNLVQVTNDSIYCANIGDSTALIINEDGNIVKLSREHSFDVKEERQRIINCGGKIDQMDGIGPLRVWAKEGGYPGLAMSRSIGDYIAHLLGVLSIPEIVKYKIDEVKPLALLVGSDGLFQFMDIDFIKEKIIKCYKSKKDINACCRELSHNARLTWINSGFKIDDITCILAFFKDTSKS